ncbi:MAG: hypothetical protein L6Q78_15935 [Bacteroidia bacterium]|nr:hypothetical protein [Bacteroidia bacterium]
MRTILSDNVSFWKKYTFKKLIQLESINFNDNNTINLKYFFTTQSSTYFKDPEKYELFRHNYEVVSGGWYGSEGRWKTVKQIYREVVFKNINNLYKSSKPRETYFEICKPRLSNTSKVVISIADENIYEFKCKDIISSEYYKTFLFDKIMDEFVDMTDSFDGMNFIGEDLFQPPPF